MMTMEIPHIAKIAILNCKDGVHIALNKENIESTEVLKHFHRKLFQALKPLVETSLNHWQFTLKNDVKEKDIKEIIDNLAKETLVDIIYN